MMAKANKLTIVLSVFVIAGNVSPLTCTPFGGLFEISDEKEQTKTAQIQLQRKIVALQQELKDILTGIHSSEEEHLLFVSVQNDLFSINSTNLQSKILVQVGDGFIVATDYDPVDGLLYWRTSAGKIERMKPDGTERQATMTGIGGIGGIAIDWIARSIYWTDENLGQISVAKLDGSFQKRLIKKGLCGPRGIAVDPAAGKMYWTEWECNQRVASASLDGSNIKDLTKDVQWPNGIALDYDRKLVYFADAKRERIDVIGMDGTGRKVFLDKETPYVFSVSFSSGYLYWNDWYTERAERVRTSDTSDRDTILVSSKRMMAITAAPSKPRPDTNLCATDNGGCTHFCFYTGQTVKCGCPDKTKDDPGAVSCFSE